jgi:RNA polymerase sigma factor for flagellar operon FliA
MDSEATTLRTTCAETVDDEVRAHLIEKHMPLAQHIANRVHRSVGGRVALEDLVHAGYVGLINAVDSFDAGRGLAFSTFAVPRIRGAIIDDLRRADVASRSVRRRQRMIAQAEHNLTGRLDRRPTARETASALDVETETLWKWKADIRQTAHASLDRPLVANEGEAPCVGEIVPGCTGLEVEDRLTREREVAVLEEEIQRLPERERMVLMLYYHEELKLREIAEILGLTESRISQIRTRAIGRLQSTMGHLRESA